MTVISDIDTALQMSLYFMSAVMQSVTINHTFQTSFLCMPYNNWCKSSYIDAEVDEVQVECITTSQTGISDMNLI